MQQWRILVLGALRLSLNIDYDRLVELANHHDTIRQMMGHLGKVDNLEPTEYTLQTVKDNLRLFTPEILARINEVVVVAGHALIKKKTRNTTQSISMFELIRLSSKPTCITQPT
jgi:hypothetical protein